MSILNWRQTIWKHSNSNLKSKERKWICLMFLLFYPKKTNSLIQYLKSLKTSKSISSVFVLNPPPQKKKNIKETCCYTITGKGWHNPKWTGSEPSALFCLDFNKSAPVEPRLNRGQQRIIVMSNEVSLEIQLLSEDFTLTLIWCCLEPLVVFPLFLFWL